jgi:hypothetical protein
LTRRYGPRRSGSSSEVEESVALTTGRQMGAMAFTPQLAMSALNQ